MRALAPNMDHYNIQVKVTWWLSRPFRVEGKSWKSVLEMRDGPAFLSLRFGPDCCLPEKLDQIDGMGN